MFKLNGKKISLDVDLTVGEGDAAITYPSGSLKASPELRAELGIVEELDPVRPDDRLFYVTENEDGTFTATPKDKSVVTPPVWLQIKAKRDELKSGGVKVGTKWYHSDTDSRIQFIGLKDAARDLLAAGQPDSTRLQKLGQDVKWKTMDGSFIFLTVKHAFDIVAAIGDLDAKAFAVAATHRAAMEAVANPFEYDFSASWPQVYADTLVPAV